MFSSTETRNSVELTVCKTVLNEMSEMSEIECDRCRQLPNGICIHQTNMYNASAMPSIIYFIITTISFNSKNGLE